MQITRGGNEIYWEEHGDPSGEPLLLCMGRAFDLRMWWPVFEALPDYRLIAFDNRGAGRTRWDGAPFLIDDLAADALAVLDAASVEVAHVYGVSLGGLTAQEIALVAPARVGSLILGCTAALPSNVAIPRVGWGRQAFALLRFVLPRKLMLCLTAKQLYGDRTDPAAIRRDREVLTASRINRSGVMAQVKATAVYASRTRLSEVTAPTLVIHGTKDRVVLYAGGVELAELVNGATLVTVPEAGHLYFGDGDVAARSVRDFLAAHSLLSHRPDLG